MTYTAKPRRKQWSGLWAYCVLCGETMDMVIEGGRKVYECGACLERDGERQLELFASASSAVPRKTGIGEGPNRFEKKRKSQPDQQSLKDNPGQVQKDRRDHQEHSDDHLQCVHHPSGSLGPRIGTLTGVRG